MERYFSFLTIILLAILGVTQVASVIGDSETADEGAHLAAGYSYLKTGDFRLNPMHPPLSKFLSALPLLPLDPHLPTEDPSWQAADDYAFAKVFLYSNRVPADKLLFYGRISTICFSLILGLVLVLWTRAYFGAPAAIFALLLYTFDPTVIAHGRYITSDLLVTLLIFLATSQWFSYLSEPTGRNLLRAGVLLGLALLTKSSAIILFPIFAVLYVIHWWQKPEEGSVRQLAGSLAACSILAFLIIYAGYGFETKSVYSNKPLARRLEMTSEQLHSDIHVSGLLLKLIDPSTALGRATHTIAGYVPLPVSTYVSGIYWQADKNRQGQEAYLLGRHSMHGWWYYFPVAFGVKTPVAVLALSAGCLYLAASRLRSLAQLRVLPMKWFVLIVPPMIYFAASMTSNINIGIRHILPIYPFFYALIAGVLHSCSKLVPALVIVAGGLLIAESLVAYPHYVAFFNTLSGGSSRGPQYLIDSNIDWGQDLKRLKAYLTTHGDRQVCLNYFGHADPAYYGIAYRNIPPQDRVDCNVAISVNSLYSEDSQVAWLRALKPVARIGYSIYYYDLAGQTR